MLNSILSNFWYDLWNPIYEKVFGGIHANSWLNWGFWIAMAIIALLVVVYIIVFWAMRPKERDDAEDIVAKRRIKRKRTKAAQLRKRAKAARAYVAGQPEDLTALQQKKAVEAALQMEQEASEAEAAANALEEELEGDDDDRSRG